MISTAGLTAPGFLVRSGSLHAWTVAAATLLAVLASAATTGAPSILMLPLSREFGSDATIVSAAFATRLVVFGIAGAFAAPLLDTFGVRRVVPAALALTGTGLFVSLATTQPWQLVLSWGVMGGLGSGLTMLPLGVVVATRWFAQSRGLFLGLFGATATSGQMIALPLLSAVTDAYGWRVCILALCAIVALAIVAVIALVPERTADAASNPDARTMTGSTFLPQAGVVGSVLRDMSGSALFWVLFGLFLVCGASTSGLVQTQFVPLCADYGVRPMQASTLLAAIGLLSFLGSIGAGWLSDRFDSALLLFWFYGLRGLSLLCLPFTDFTLVGLSLFAAVYGLDWIATIPPTVKLIVARYGRARAGIVFGWVFVGHQLGAGLAVFGAGLSRDGLQSFLPAAIAAGGLCLLAASAILAVAPAPPRTAPEAGCPGLS